MHSRDFIVINKILLTKIIVKFLNCLQKKKNEIRVLKISCMFRKSETKLNNLKDFRVFRVWQGFFCILNKKIMM